MQDKPAQDQPSNPKKQIYKTLLKWIPWIIGSSVLIYLIGKIEIKQLVEALSHAQIIIYIPALIIFIYVAFLLDTQNLQALMNNFGHAITFAESLVVRGASYLINVIDYTLGMGSVVYFLNITKHIPLLRGTAIMIYYNYINQVALILLTGVGYLLLGRPAPWLTKILLACLAIACLSVMVIGVIKYALHPWAEVVRQVALVRPFSESSVKVYMKNIIYRVGYYFSYVLFFYAAVRAFGMDIPFITLLAYVPVILLVISIPISPFGLGTSQATMIFLFRDYGSPPQILAFSLAYSLSVLLLRTILGAYYYWIMAGKINLARIQGGSELAGKTDSETA